ncbi:hypothetical protein B0H12DRAFT_1235443 [Mycena haematopus]|nr:hypothetical protein B0H12DRAFT_1235443 [Mycena haematopus]
MDADDVVVEASQRGLPHPASAALYHGVAVLGGKSAPRTPHASVPPSAPPPPIFLDPPPSLLATRDPFWRGHFAPRLCLTLSVSVSVPRIDSRGDGIRANAHERYLDDAYRECAPLPPLLNRTLADESVLMGPCIVARPVGERSQRTGAADARPADAHRRRRARLWSLLSPLIRRCIRHAPSIYAPCIPQVKLVAGREGCVPSSSPSLSAVLYHLLRLGTSFRIAYVPRIGSSSIHLTSPPRTRSLPVYYPLPVFGHDTFPIFVPFHRVYIRIPSSHPLLYFIRTCFTLLRLRISLFVCFFVPYSFVFRRPVQRHSVAPLAGTSSTGDFPVGRGAKAAERRGLGRKDSSP